MLGAAQVSQLPNSNLPEVAFIGRSNVGKSSLINALVGRRNLVKVSNTPGRTQQINFFNLANRLMLVDLPGYGYAKISKAQKQQWNVLIDGYLQNRPQLRRVLIMIDCRHGLKPADHEIMDLLDEAAAPYQLIFTKLDKLRPSETPQTNFDKSQHAALMHEFFATSASEKIGINELQASLASITKE